MMLSFLKRHIPQTLKDLYGRIVERRSPKWPSVRLAHLKIQPTCQACGRSDCVQVHHKQSFAEHPELELDPNNLITLCENDPARREDHLNVGHKPRGQTASWKKINPYVVTDAAKLLAERTRKP